jgi:hypothetical protein
VLVDTGGGYNLVFTPGTNQTGSATFMLTVKDFGGTVFGGTDTATQNFTINIQPPNNPPIFTLSNVPISRAINSGAATITPFLNVTSPGTGDPAQTPYTPTLTRLSTTNADLFAAGPALVSTLRSPQTRSAPSLTR